MPGFSVKEDSRLGKAIKKRGKKAVTDLLLGGGFALRNISGKSRIFNREDIMRGIAGKSRKGKGATMEKSVEGLMFKDFSKKALGRLQELFGSGSAKSTKIINKGNRKN